MPFFALLFFGAPGWRLACQVRSALLHNEAANWFFTMNTPFFTILPRQLFAPLLPLFSFCVEKNQLISVHASFARKHKEPKGRSAAYALNLMRWKTGEVESVLDETFSRQVGRVEKGNLFSTFVLFFFHRRTLF